MRDLARLLSGLAIATAVAGCASGSRSAGPPAPDLIVHIGLYGGPARPDGGMADSNTPQPNARVSIVDAAGHERSAVTGVDGVVRFSVRPGRYTVHSPCGHGPKHVAVRADRPSLVQIRCDIP